MIQYQVTIATVAPIPSSSEMASNAPLKADPGTDVSLTNDENLRNTISAFEVDPRIYRHRASTTSRERRRGWRCNRNTTCDILFYATDRFWFAERRGE